jgi:uncharacterized membrane protein
MITKKAVNAMLLSAVALTVGGFTAAHAEEPAMEKCYGVVKAGKNDCASADKSHSCAGHATADANKNEFVKVPAGLCDKLAGGSTEAPKAE